MSEIIFTYKGKFYSAEYINGTFCGVNGYGWNMSHDDVKAVMNDKNFLNSFSDAYTTYMIDHNNQDKSTTEQFYITPMKREYVRKHTTITEDGQYIPDEELVRSTMKEISRICNDHSIPMVGRYKEVNAYNMSVVAGYLSQSDKEEQWNSIYIMNILVLAILMTNTEHCITHPDKLYNFLIEWMDDHEDYLKNLINDYDIEWMRMYMEIAGHFSKAVKAVLKKEEDVKINNIS